MQISIQTHSVTLPNVEITSTSLTTNPLREETIYEEHVYRRSRVRARGKTLPRKGAARLSGLLFDSCRRARQFTKGNRLRHVSGLVVRHHRLRLPFGERNVVESVVTPWRSPNRDGATGRLSRPYGGEANHEYDALGSSFIY
jgi:hypothetical protein